MILLADVLEDVSYLLGDPDKAVWDDTEITRYVNSGLLQIGRDTRLVWETTFLDCVSGTATYTLPQNLVSIDRVTWNGYRVTPFTPRQAREVDLRYRSQTGEVYGYLLEEDGINTIRLVRVPASSAVAYVVDPASPSYAWGLLRRPEDISNEAVSGSWGVLRRCAGLHPEQSEWGVPRKFRYVTEDLNSKVEYYRTPTLPYDNYQAIDLPDRYVKYLRWHCLWRCYEREGKGQDLAASMVYQKRWEAGLSRILERANKINAARLSALGAATGIEATGPPRPKLPWQFGTVVRTRRR